MPGIFFSSPAALAPLQRFGFPCRLICIAGGCVVWVSPCVGSPIFTVRSWLRAFLPFVALGRGPRVVEALRASRPVLLRWSMLHLLPPPGSPPFLLPIRIARSSWFLLSRRRHDLKLRGQICCLYLRVVFCSSPGSELPPVWQGSAEVAASFPYLVVVLFSHLMTPF
ncbi:hypothetical protein EJB05_33482 [Eragrostis curvula]|uniref:Uncharacterized protein n=1 Tax=Eragrostis curvula TaxID=38414 RepID=A0A5J9U1G5_9POAL|nr:hypothetical protein EJB05_33482 [Eragrostis curvula]